MNRQFILTLYVSTLSTLIFSQDSLSSKVVGKWAICYSLDTLDKTCNTPFNFYTFNADGTCQHGEVTIMDKKIPKIGNWKIENGSIMITYDKHTNFSYPPETFPNISFLSINLFYYKVIGKEEVPGRWIFFCLRRID